VLVLVGVQQVRWPSPCPKSNDPTALLTHKSTQNDLLIALVVERQGDDADLLCSCAALRNSEGRPGGQAWPLGHAAGNLVVQAWQAAIDKAPGAALSTWQWARHVADSVMELVLAAGDHAAAGCPNTQEKANTNLLIFIKLVKLTWLMEFAYY
jgi:hypothetical protein